MSFAFKFNSIVPNFGNHLEENNNNLSEFPANLLENFEENLDIFLHDNFGDFEIFNQELVKTMQDFKIKLICFDNQKPQFPDDIGRSLTKFLREQDFLAVFWFFLKFLCKSLEEFLLNPVRKVTPIANYELEKKMVCVSPIINMLKVLLIASFSNEFCFNYSFLILLNWLLLLNPLTPKPENTQSIQIRLSTLLATLVMPLDAILFSEDWYLKDVKINMNIFRIFPRLILGDNFYLLWKKLSQKLTESFAC